jgi:aminoglycoside phosphotransferase (APT) family kinase protein
MPDNLMDPFADINLEKLSKNLIMYIRKELNQESADYLEPPVRLTGGYETLICRFQLSGVDESLSKPLVIRLFSERVDAEMILKESEIQNTLSGQDYPVPAVYLTCMDKSVLGGLFFIMDFCGGHTLNDSGLSHSQVFGILGNLQARMHKIDIEVIEKRCTEIGADINTLKYEFILEEYRAHFRSNFPWMNKAVGWLFENCPKEPESLSICHGDFHPMNILYEDGKVQAVLDWSGFMIGDPAMDVARTEFLLSIPIKLLFPELEPDQVKEIYLKAYRQTRPLDETNIAYYYAFRSISALSEGIGGHTLFGQPEIIQLLLASIHEITGIKIDIPSKHPFFWGIRKRLRTWWPFFPK